jgi:hypothetical protein
MAAAIGQNQGTLCSFFGGCGFFGNGLIEIFQIKIGVGIV